jgi:predicted permease
MDALFHDERFALRTLAKSPVFTLVATMCIALGIGANTTVFSLVNAALLRPMPVPQADRLVRVYTSEWDPHGVSSRRFGRSSYPDYLDWRDKASVFEGLAASTRASMSVGHGATAEQVGGVLVTGNFFTTLRAPIAVGRFFNASDDAGPGTGRVAVLSHRFWQKRFAGDRGVVGKTIEINGQWFAIVGVAAEGFHGTEVEQAPDVWVPTSARDVILAGRNWIERRDSRGIAVVGRLTDGVTLPGARAAMTTLMRQVGAAYPEMSGNRVVTLMPVRGLVAFEEGGGEVLGVFATLMAVVGLVLLVACANVANLLLARAAHRRREIAIRLSLGAGRSRVVRQLLTESILLGLLGGVAGLLLAMWGTEGMKLLPFPPTLDFSPDGRVLAFTFATALATGIIFGLAPALRATRPALVPLLKDGSEGTGSSRSRLRTTLIAGQMAFSLVVLVAAGLLLRTLQNLQTADPGFTTDHVLVADFDLQMRNYQRPAGERFYADLRARLSTLPGVAAATWVQSTPLNGSLARRYTTIPGYQVKPGEREEIAFNVIGPLYFKTLGIPLVAGRDFTDADRMGAQRVVIVNESMAKHYWPNGDAIGRRIQQGPNDSLPRLVVGIAKDTRHENMTSPTEPFFFLPLGQSYSATMSLVMRSSGRDAAALTADLRREVKALDNALPIHRIRTMTEMRGQSLEMQRTVASMLGAFGALALFLASVGVFGVMSYLVSQRTRELGVRIALGARPASVLSLVVSQGVRMAMIGVGVGLVLALGATRLLSGMLYGVSPTDPVVFGGVALLLTAAAALASWVPARRATRVDPVVALRAE